MFAVSQSISKVGFKRANTDDYDDCRKVSKTATPRFKLNIRPTSMANLLGINLSELELVQFFNEHSLKNILKANDKRDIVWISTAPQKMHSSAVIRKTCMFLASVDLSRRRVEARAEVERNERGRSMDQYTWDEERSRDTSCDTMMGSSSDESDDVTKTVLTLSIYTPIEEEVQEKLLEEFTTMLTMFRMDLEQHVTDDYLTMLLSATLLYVSALSLGPLVPILQLLSLARGIKLTHEVFSGDFTSTNICRPAPAVERKLLPREEDLWNLISIAGKSDMPDDEKALVVDSLAQEINTMAEFYNMDLAGGCITHMSSWCVYTKPAFNLLLHECNPYALVFMAYYCAYVHLFHEFSWWRDRAVNDLWSIIDLLPDEFLHLVEWPIAACERWDCNHLDYLSGRFREMHI